MRLRGLTILLVVIVLFFGIQTSIALAQEPSDPDPWPGEDPIWQQFVEEESGNINETFPDSYWTVQTDPCDTDPGDYEYLFKFNMNYNQDPDSLRWNGDWKLRTAFGSLKSLAYDWNEVRVCMPKDAVDNIGGPNHVMTYFRLHLK